MKRLGCALAISWALCGGAFAKSTAPAPVDTVAAPPSPHSIDLAKRYLNDIDYDAVVDRMFATLLPPMMKLATDHNPNVTEDQKAAILAAAQNALAAWQPKYVERLRIEIVRIYTDEELEGAVAFYESPPGKSMIAKQGDLSKAAVRLAAEMNPELRNLMLEQMCKILDCSKLKQPPSQEKS